jgi:hypothetical protein
VLTYGRDAQQYHNDIYKLMVKKPCLLVKKYNFSVVIRDIFKIWALISNFTNGTSRTDRSPYVHSRTAAICLTVTQLSVHLLLYFLRVLGDYPNTYAYTKALSEGLVAEQMDKLPVLILRPSIGKTLFYIHDKLFTSYQFLISFSYVGLGLLYGILLQTSPP